MAKTTADINAQANINATKKANARIRLLKAVNVMPNSFPCDHIEAGLITKASIDIYGYKHAKDEGEILIGDGRDDGWMINPRGTFLNNYNSLIPR
jgi:hypothetical protein